MCKKLHHLIDKIDEERYDCESKVQKADKEVRSHVFNCLSTHLLL